MAPLHFKQKCEYYSVTEKNVYIRRYNNFNYESEITVDAGLKDGLEKMQIQVCFFLFSRA